MSLDQSSSTGQEPRCFAVMADVRNARVHLPKLRRLSTQSFEQKKSQPCATRSRVRAEKDISNVEATMTKQDERDPQPALGKSVSKPSKGCHGALGRGSSLAQFAAQQVHHHQEGGRV